MGGMITAQDFRDGLVRALVHGTGEGPGTSAGLPAALASADATELKAPLRLAGREAACAGHTLATVLERWETLVVAAAAGLHVATRGAAWLAQGYAEARTRRAGDSPQQGTRSPGSRQGWLP